MPQFYNLIKNLLQVNFIFAHFIYMCKYYLILMMELFNQRRCCRAAASRPGQEREPSLGAELGFRGSGEDASSSQTGHGEQQPRR